MSKGEDKMRFRSGFARYMVTFGTIILVSFFILSVILAAMLQDYNKQMTMEDLSQAANSVSDLVEDEIAGSYLDISEYLINDYDNVRNRISSVTRYMNELYVFVTDVNGSILITNDTVPDGYFKKDLPSSYVNDVMEGRGKEYRGTLQGVLLNDHYVYIEPVLTEANVVEGVVVAIRNTDYAFGYVTKTIQTTMMVSMWVMIAAIIASYFISERTAKPLR